MTDYLLKIEKLYVRYNKEDILKDLSLFLEENKVHVLIGQNGSGKSTLVKTITRIIKERSGIISYNGINLNNMEAYNLNDIGVSWLPQGSLVLPNLTVEEHFEIILRNKPNNLKNELISNCFHYFPTLKELMNRRGGNLSGGQRQMLSLGLLKVQNNDLWILDEATAGLDSNSTGILFDFFNKIKKETNITILMVEHNYKIAFGVADTVAIIKEGRITSHFRNNEFKSEDFLDKYLYT